MNSNQKTGMILGTSAALLLFFVFRGKASAAKPHAGPHVLPPPPPADGGASAPAVTRGVSRPLSPHRYAGRTWSAAREWMLWAVARYHDAMDAAEDSFLRAQGYENESDEWFALETENPDEWQRIVAAGTAVRRDALARAIREDGETTANLLVQMRWAKMTPGAVNEDVEMHQFATELDEGARVASLVGI